MKTSLLTSLLTLIGIVCFGQEESQLPAISPLDFDVTSQLIDSSAHAIVLYEKGRSDIQILASNGKMRVIHQYSARIKILDREGFGQANQMIPLYRNGDNFEDMWAIRATTHNLENDSVVSLRADRKAFFDEKVSEYLTLKKFTLPNIRENSIIDIEYTMYSPDIFNYRTWEFQSDIPKIYSEYTANIPGAFDYAVTLRGPYGLSREVKGRAVRCNFVLGGRKFDCSNMTYIMENIPAFKEENYMLAAKNYKAAMYFELKEYYSFRGKKQLVTKEWENVDRELLTDKRFGGQISNEAPFRDILPPLTADLSSAEKKARAIYGYIQKNVRWNKHYGKYSQVGIKELLAQRSGNAGDINLALIAALRAADIECHPVILSTRENGLPNDLHPVISGFNYVIAAVKIDNEIHFLDATERYLPFGELPLRCINGNGRIIYSAKSSEWIELKNKQPSQLSYTIKGKIGENGVFDGEINITYNGFEALHRRNQIAGFPSAEAYMEDKIQKLSGFNVKDGSVMNLDETDKPLAEQLAVSIDFSNHIQNNQFSFNPVIIDRTTKNPFNLEERTYPVDMGARRMEIHSIQIELPDGYQIADGPKNVKLVLPENTAEYRYRTSYENNKLELHQSVHFNKAIYSVEEYFHLKEFYSRMIQQQKIDFLFRKSL